MALDDMQKIGYFSGILLFLLSYGYTEGRTCGRIVGTPGYTVPQGDIALEFGKDPLNITCIIDDQHTVDTVKNISNKLSFRNGSKPLPREMFREVSPRSIELYIKSPPLGGSANFECLFDGGTVCSNLVSVGHAPSPITDFKCIGYNHENLTCTWTAPNNFVNTDYKLEYKTMSARPTIHTCPRIDPVQDSNQLQCVWTPYDVNNKVYKQAHREFKFFLTAKNIFGDYTYNLTFMHFKHVLPAPPERLRVVNTTTSSILLSWVIPYAMESFPPGVHHRVLYQCQYSDGTWRLSGIIKNYPKHKPVLYNLTGIEHPNIVCDIRVALRSAYAHYSDESMWSNNASTTALTASAIPAVPPATDIGSYELQSVGNDMEHRMAYVYWKDIAEELQNGPNFRYNVVVEGELDRQPEKVTNLYAQFPSLSLGKSYTFCIWSENEVGKSLQKSVLRIPSQAERPNAPTSFTKVEYKDGVFELSWKPPEPKEGQEITSYTIFWCSNDRDRPYQCRGKLGWDPVPANVVTYNKTVPNGSMYQFAISANTRTASSGMLWAACTVIYNGGMSKMQNVWFNHVGATYMELGWKLDCSDRIGTVNGYIIHYCPIVAPKKTECKPGSQRNRTVKGDSRINTATVGDLMPYTTYMLTISVITRYSNVSQQSDPLLNTTLEAAPTPPVNFTYTKVTDTSVFLRWAPPAKENGKLIYYVIQFNNETKEFNPAHEFELTNLESYQNYSIAIKACTVACSNFSESLHIRTSMGHPGKVDQPSITLLNNSLVLVSWKRPKPARGKVDYYQVHITQKLDDNNVSLPLLNTTARSYTIEDCGEDGKYNSFFINVRAVNLVNGRRMEGPWSDTFESYCRTSRNYMLFLYIFLGCLFIGAVAFSGRRMYDRCRLMLDVQVKLPPGMATDLKVDTLVPWKLEKLHEEREGGAPADEQMLLAKAAEGVAEGVTEGVTGGRQKSGESSGCSSAHESATPSVQSAQSAQSVASGASSDSGTGTEQPRSQPAEQRESSLRLRNVPSVRPAAGKGYVALPPEAAAAAAPAWPAKAAAPAAHAGQPPGNYCVLGVDPAGAAAPYVAVPPAAPAPTPAEAPRKLAAQLSAQPSPYVLTGDLVKSVNPGYVPYQQELQELRELRELRELPEAKSAPYVVAGSKGGLLLPQPPQAPRPAKLEEEAASPLPARAAAEPGKGYVSHRQFELKTLKED